MAMPDSWQNNDARGKNDKILNGNSLICFLILLSKQLIAVERLHKAGIVHKDVQHGNVVFGTEPEPENRKERRDGVMYDTDVFLFGKI